VKIKTLQAQHDSDAAHVPAPVAGNPEMFAQKDLYCRNRIKGNLRIKLRSFRMTQEH